MEEYITKDHCKECDHVLSSDQRSYSNGTCPYCGNTNNGTMVKTIKVKYKWVKFRVPFWKFWVKRGYWERME